MTLRRQQGWFAWTLSTVLFIASATALWFYSDIAQQYDDASNALTTAQSQLRSEELLRENAERTIKSLEGDRQEWRSQERTLQETIESLERDVAQLKTDLANSEQTNRTLTRSLEEKDATLSQTQSNIEQLQNQLTEAATTEELYLAAREALALEQAENETYSETIARLEAEMAAEAEAMSALEEKLQSQLSELNQENEKLVTQLEDGTTAIKLPESILFASGSAQISDEGQQALAVLGDALQSFPTHLISVQGHTDSQKISANTAVLYPSNWELSTARASSAVRALLSIGIPASQLQAVGFADTQPLVAETDAGTRQQNRRIEVILFPNQFKTELLSP